MHLFIYTRYFQRKITSLAGIRDCSKLEKLCLVGEWMGQFKESTLDLNNKFEVILNSGLILQFIAQYLTGILSMITFNDWF